VYCWGSDGHQQLGDGTRWSTSVPVRVTGLSGVRRLAAGREFMCAVLSTGGVSCWGQGVDGQLGNGLTGESAVPLPVAGLSDIVDVAAGSDFACALSAQGRLWCWGGNYYGQMGIGTITTWPPSPPVEVGLGGVVTQITAGFEHACVRLVDSTIACWGRNENGQTGTTPSTFKWLPQLVPGITTALEVRAGYSSTCARLIDSSVKCWGSGADGRLGNASSIGSASPVAVSGMSGATSLTMGYDHTCVTRVIGDAECWGSQAHGQLGTYTIDAVPGSLSSVPVGVQDTGVAVAISAGTWFTCVLGPTGIARCWGYSSDGQTGTGLDLHAPLVLSPLTPTLVAWDVTAPAATVPSVSIAAGFQLSGTSVPLAVSSRVSDPGGFLPSAVTLASGPGASRFGRSTNGGGTWTTTSAIPATQSSASTTARIHAPTTGSVRFRVTPVDRAGWSGPTRTGVAVSARLVQGSSTSVHYSGAWTTAGGTAYSGGSVRWASGAGASASYTFTGRGIGLVTSFASPRGAVKVYVDGVLKATVDCGSGTANRMVAWQKTWSTPGAHTLKVVVVGTPGRSRVDLDAFVVLR
ncbi:MAG: hypothetical protein WCK58_15300, partial [Chloroflexota bacterium]